MLFLIGILPALVWSLLKEKRFVKRNNLFAYGLLAIIFGAVETYGVPVVDANLREALLLFFIVGVVWVLIAFYTKDSRNMLFGFKSIAAFEIPVMLYLYSVVVTEWNEVFWAGVMLFFVFNAYSYLTRKESDRPYRKPF